MRPDPPWEGVILRGRPIVKYRDPLRSSVQKRLNRSRCRLGYWAWMGPSNHMLDGGPQVPRDIAIATNFGTHGSEHWRYLANTLEPPCMAMRTFVKLV